MANIVVAIWNPLHKDNGIFPYFETFLNGFKDAGNNVLCFEKSALESVNLGDIPEKFLNQIKNFNPDLFIFFNNQFWDISKYFDVPIIVYDVDSPNAYCNIDNLKNNSKYKYLCITKSGKDIIKNVVGCSDNDVCYIPPFTGVVAQNIPNERTIGFCGSHWLWNDFNEIMDFIQQNPSREDIINAKKIYGIYKQNPHLSIEEIYKSYDAKSSKCFNVNNLLVFSARISGLKRLRYLLEIEDLGLEIRGQHWNNKGCNMLKAFPELLLSYSLKKINDTKTTQDFYNSSKIGFNTTHIQAKTGFGWRVADILASNACLVTEKSKDLLELGFDIPTYSTPTEARELCIKLLNDEDYRQGIVEKCHEIIDKNHRFENVLPIIEDFIGMKLHSDLEGSLEIINTDKKVIFPDINYKNLKTKDKIYYKISRYFYKKLVK